MRDRERKHLDESARCGETREQFGSEHAAGSSDIGVRSSLLNYRLCVQKERV